MTSITERAPELATIRAFGWPERDGAVIDDIEITDGYPVDETIRRVGQLG